MMTYLTSPQLRLIEMLESTEKSSAKRLVVHDSGLGITAAARRFVDEQPSSRRYFSLSYGSPIADQLRRIVSQSLAQWSFAKIDQRQTLLKFPVQSALLVVDNIEFLGGSKNLTKFIATLNDIPASQVRLGFVLIGHDNYMCGATGRDDIRNAANRLSRRAINIVGPACTFRADALSDEDKAFLSTYFAKTPEAARYIKTCFAAECLFPAFKRVKVAANLLDKRPDLLADDPETFASYLAHERPLPELPGDPSGAAPPAGALKDAGRAPAGGVRATANANI